VSPSTEHYTALFEPRGIVVAGASSHPGKFGFVALHNILACGYEGSVYATNREGIEVLGRPTLASLDEVPDGEADLVFVCTPAAANPDLLRTAAKKGMRAAFIASAGYGEAGEDGRRLQDELVELADELDILVVGPNGQGLVSTPASLCAQIVAPYPPPGRIGIVSQSGNFVSAFMNYARSSGVGVSRAVSAGNAAQVGVVDFLDFFADDDATDVALVYVEGVRDGRRFFERLRAVSERLPVVLVKGGATSGGARAAASHTGSLATDDRVFDGMCRQAGAIRAGTIEEAYEAAATFATQPLPRTNQVAVVSTAGGWGVVTADAIAGTDLELLSLPDDLLADLDTRLPPRWSRNNPIDMAGGETKDTIPEVLAAVARHDAVDGIIFLGMGIQSNQGKLEQEGPFYPEHGLERIVAFHDRQDRRYTSTAAELSDTLGKPILTASELALTAPDNAAVRGVVESGRYCYPSANRAVVALEHLWHYARWRQRHGSGGSGGATT
jgi:acyl-CoA synthetase (NDP forming)